MKEAGGKGRRAACFLVALFVLGCSAAAADRNDGVDSVELSPGVLAEHYPGKTFVPGAGGFVSESIRQPFSNRFIHRIAVEFRPGYIAPTHAFLNGQNAQERAMRQTFSGHLKYAFQFRPGTEPDRISGSAYQGIGVSGHSFFNTAELGNPVAVYLLQGARICSFHPRLSLNYEWNFGLSFGWNPFSYETNPYNQVVGSNLNACLNANFYLRWMLSRQVDLTAGFSAAHFSNGSTKLPNAGVNTLGLTFGLMHCFNRENGRYIPRTPLRGPAFRRHMSYDLILFGAWRQKGIRMDDGTMHASPESYPVFGFNAAAMYNLGYKFRAGASLDGVYDGSANVWVDESSGSPEFQLPFWYRQISLGASARAEYVMPYFTIAFGMGTNFLHGGGDLRFFYQLLALKIDTGRHSYVHIGYSLKEFKSPNFLMLGMGHRFNSKPQTYRK